MQLSIRTVHVGQDRAQRASGEGEGEHSAEDENNADELLCECATRNVSKANRCNGCHCEVKSREVKLKVCGILETVSDNPRVRVEVFETSSEDP